MKYLTTGMLFYIMTLLSMMVSSQTFDNPTFQTCVSASNNVILCKKEGPYPLNVWNLEPRAYWDTQEVVTEGVPLIVPGMSGNTFNIHLPWETIDGVFMFLLEDNDYSNRSTYYVEDFDDENVIEGIPVENFGTVVGIHWMGVNHLLVLESENYGMRWTVYNDEMLSFNSTALSPEYRLQIKEVGGTVFFVSAFQIAWLSSDYTSVTIIDNVLHYNHDDTSMYYLRNGTWGFVKDGIDSGEIPLGITVGDQLISTFIETEWLIFDQDCYLSVIDHSSMDQHSIYGYCDVRAVTVNPFSDYFYVQTSEDLIVYKAGYEKAELTSIPNTDLLYYVAEFFVATPEYLILYAELDLPEEDDILRLKIFNITDPNEITLADEFSSINTDGLPANLRFTYYPESSLIHFIADGSITILYLIPEEVKIIPENCLDVNCRTCEEGWTGVNCATVVIETDDSIIPIINCATLSGGKYTVFLGYLDTGVTVSAPSIADVTIDDGDTHSRVSIFSFVETRRMRNFVFSETCDETLSWLINDIEVLFSRDDYMACPNTLSVILTLKNVEKFPTSTQRDALLKIIKNKIVVKPTYHFIDDWQSEKRTLGSVELQLQITSSGDQQASAAMAEFVLVSEEPDLIDSFRIALDAPNITMSIEPLASGVDSFGSPEIISTTSSTSSTTSTSSTETDIDNTESSSIIFTLCYLLCSLSLL